MDLAALAGSAALMLVFFGIAAGVGWIWVRLIGYDARVVEFDADETSPDRADDRG